MLHLVIASVLIGVLLLPAGATQRASYAALPGTPATPAEIVDRLSPSIVQVLPHLASGADGSHVVGSGVAVAEGVITTDQVVREATQADIVTNDGRRGTATVSRRSPLRDLVLLTTDLVLPPTDLEPATSQRVGDSVLVIGYPRPDGLGDPTLTVTRGLVSALRHDQEGITYLQTDAPMDPGVAGGAVVNMRGHLIGLPSFNSLESSGLNFGVGAEEVQSLVQQATSAASSEATYSLDPQAALPTPSDLGPPWQEVSQPSALGAGDPGAAGAPVASGRLVHGDLLAPTGSYGELRAIVEVASDAQQGQWVWERALRHPPAGFVRLPDPMLGSSCHLYQRTQPDGADVQVFCRDANVVIGVALSGTSDVATTETAVRAAGAILQHVQDGSTP